MAYRPRMFRAKPFLKREKVKTVEGTEIEVIDRGNIYVELRNIDYDMTTRERAQRYARRVERFCRYF